MMFEQKLTEFSKLKTDVTAQIERGITDAKNDDEKEGYVILGQIFKRTIADDMIGAFERYCTSPSENSLIAAEVAYIHMLDLPARPMGRIFDSKSQPNDKEDPGFVAEIKKLLPGIVDQVKTVCAGLPFAIAAQAETSVEPAPDSELTPSTKILQFPVKRR